DFGEEGQKRLWQPDIAADEQSVQACGLERFVEVESLPSFYPIQVKVRNPADAGHARLGSDPALFQLFFDVLQPGVQDLFDAAQLVFGGHALLDADHALLEAGHALLDATHALLESGHPLLEAGDPGVKSNREHRQSQAVEQDRYADGKE